MLSQISFLQLCSDEDDDEDGDEKKQSNVPGNNLTGMGTKSVYSEIISLRGIWNCSGHCNCKNNAGNDNKQDENSANNNTCGIIQLSLLFYGQILNGSLDWSVFNRMTHLQRSSHQFWDPLINGLMIAIMMLAMMIVL